MTGNDKAEIKACLFFGTMAAIFFSGAALTMENTMQQAIGTAMVFFVIGFLLAMMGFAHMRKAAADEADTK